MPKFIQFWVPFDVIAKYPDDPKEEDFYYHAEPQEKLLAFCRQVSQELTYYGNAHFTNQIIPFVHAGAEEAEQVAEQLSLWYEDFYPELYTRPDTIIQAILNRRDMQDPTTGLPDVEKILSADEDVVPILLDHDLTRIQTYLNTGGPVIFLSDGPDTKIRDLRAGNDLLYSVNIAKDNAVQHLSIKSQYAKSDFLATREAVHEGDLER